MTSTNDTLNAMTAFDEVVREDSLLYFSKRANPLRHIGAPKDDDIHFLLHDLRRLSRDYPPSGPLSELGRTLASVDSDRLEDPTFVRALSEEARKADAEPVLRILKWYTHARDGLTPSRLAREVLALHRDRTNVEMSYAVERAVRFVNLCRLGPGATTWFAIVSNLAANAIRAAESAPSPYVKLHAYRRDDEFVYEIKNSARSPGDPGLGVALRLANRQISRASGRLEFTVAFREVVARVVVPGVRALTDDS